ncbi:MAG: hypothetical protein L6Q95_01730 [Planctomycetes bacterium]|nr:hypothetical protein [Planctomycetota bacterium]
MRRAAWILLLALPAAAGNAVTVHGIVLRGDLSIEGEEVVLAKKSSRKRYPKADFLLAESDDGKLLYAPSFEARLRGYEHLARADRAEACVKLLEAAVAARDAALSRRLLEMAQADGFTGKPADDWKKKVEGLEERRPTVDQKKAEAAAERVDGIVSIPATMLVARARADEADGLRLLREALRLAPTHEGARSLLGQRAPADFKLGPPAFWLDWHLDLETGGAKVVPETDRDFLATRAIWTPDVYGVDSGPIRIVTPVRDTLTVGRCLAYGRLTCAALAEMFKTAAPRLRASRSLTVLLYPTKEEYIARSLTRGSHEERASLAATAGHYSPDDRVSRVVWDTDPDAERRIARVFVHELTHHWVNEMNPRYGDSELRRHGGVPGYWIVEGFATFIEEGTFDISAGTWDFFDARAASLDTVHALAGGGLLPWETVYESDQGMFAALSRDPNDARPVVRRWRLGSRGVLPARLFYEQAAATVHFLYHGENGAYRDRLIEYVTSYYTGKKEKLDIRGAFGMSAAELGAKVATYAASVAAGFRPAGP